ncbi:hypothetical protein GCM10022276_10580 [Sphingomonas limnosediminicola]|uniref:Glycosyltransferase family 25 protein n=1 Tax=Sphingomonas limnosediminicola TaxID=940133 RepID=A0ABP7L364_9SPHN
MTVFQRFDRIRIINLASRRDRRAQMTGELRRLGLDRDTRVQFVDGIIVDDKRPFRAPGEKGVFLAHLSILTDAAAAGESVLILEDDVDFTPAAREWEPSPDCDVCYGGYNAINPDSLEDSDIYGAHCMGFSARAVKELVPFLTGLLKHPSPPPIDGAYVWFRRQREGFSTEFATPIVAVQRPSRSDITPSHRLDFVPNFARPMGLLRGFKRELRRGRLTFGLPEAIVVAVIGVGITIAAAWHYSGR